VPADRAPRRRGSNGLAGDGEAGFETSVPLAREVPERSNKTASTSGFFFAGGPRVRIHLSPAESPSLSRIRFRKSRTRLSARVCAAGLATGSAETRRVFRYHANRRRYLCRAIFQYRSATDGVGENATPSQQSQAFSRLNVGRSLKPDRLKQSRARSADRARPAADVSDRGAFLPSNRAAAAHRGSPR